MNFTGHSIITKEDLPPTFRMVTSVPEGKQKDGRTLASAEGREMTAEKMVLQILFTALREGRRIGREGILAQARNLGMPMTQPQVRAILGRLEAEDCVAVSRGRGGSVITEKGIGLLKQAGANVGLQ